MAARHTLFLTFALAALGNAASAQTCQVSAAQISTPERGAAAATAPDVSDATRPTTGVVGRSDLVSLNPPIAASRRPAEAPPPLSRPADGRAVTASPIGGQDSCDPAAPGPPSKICRERIETRAAEYAKPRPAPITSEARLLILSNPEPAATADGALRRLGSETGVEALAGSAADTLAGALQTGRTGASNTDPAAGAAGGAAADLPANLVLKPH